LVWEQAAFNGGAIIEDYRITINAVDSDYTATTSGLTSPEFLATGLDFGITYELKVESRNSYGYSGYSDAYLLYCGFISETATTLSTTNSNDVVVLSWNLPVNNGAVITAYKVFIREHDSTTYT
jgi:hypothetical protein